MGSNVVCAFASTQSLHLFDKCSGASIGAILVGPQVHQQWSAPVPLDDHRALLGRVDGRLSIVDVSARELVASISLATREVSRGPVDTAASQEVYALYPGRRPLGICATPAVVGGRVFVGTTTGDLYALDVGSSDVSVSTAP
jgi:outer membrane protein assembly factor BamB